MSLIINPNAPPAPKARNEDLNYILQTMGIIARFRTEYLDLHTRLDGDDITAREIEEIEEAKLHIAEAMVRFIIWGKLE